MSVGPPSGLRCFACDGRAILRVISITKLPVDLSQCLEMIALLAVVDVGFINFLLQQGSEEG